MSCPFVKGQKQDYAMLFQSLEGFSKLQSYSPAVCRLDGIAQGESILQHRNLAYVERHACDNSYCVVTTTGEDEVRRNAYFKFCPITDPVYYLTGTSQLDSLPSENDDNVQPHKAAYVDSVFTQLASAHGRHYGLINSVECFGSFLGVKDYFKYDVSEDLDNLLLCEHFLKSNDVTYHDTSGILGVVSSGAVKVPLKIEPAGTESIPLTLDNLESEVDSRSPSQACKRLARTSSSSSVSSRESNTSDEAESSDSEPSEDGEDEEQEMNVQLLAFPVIAVAMEEMVGTLDSLLLAGKHAMGQGELAAALMQVIMSLITFQKAFDLTHNDLHSSNIMYTRTNKTHIWYKVDGRFYKVPTFGKIWKIIDFGRAIFRCEKQLFCSGSFLKGGDAYSQYNFGPCYDDGSSLVEPNKSFDLCRLGVSLLDLVDSRGLNDTDVGKIVEHWCSMDNGKNILYKSNGDERYPHFKLYKMIARKVSNHLPSAQLQARPFSKFEVRAQKAKKAESIINVDSVKQSFEVPA